MIPIILCIYGLYFAFHHFWNGFDAISGDLGDARFNALVLEHTWLWITGVHSSLFNTPMFFPHENIYAYSDLLLSVSPVYWCFRLFGIEVMLSYQLWLMSMCVLNFSAFYILAKNFLHFRVFLAALGAYLFSFSLPRISHMEHAQLVPQFFIVISLMGALLWWKTPKAKTGAVLLLGGAVLQFLCAFYFFWFFLWSVVMVLAYVLMNQERRDVFLSWFRQLDWKFLLLLGAILAATVAPFFYHYALVAGEVGRRSWVTISNSVPRLYSWINLPKDHWEWSFVPFKTWITELAVGHEHYLSFGLLTWISMILGLVWTYRQKQHRIFTIPVLAMFFFTLTSGRFSSWVLIAYLFPGGGAVRAVARIQMFMLLFWSMIWIYYLAHLLMDKKIGKKIAVAFIVLGFFAENTYQSDWVFSRGEDHARLQKMADALPADCEVMVYDQGFYLDANSNNNDAVMIAFTSHRMTVNGYSGNQPKQFTEIFIQQPSALDQQLQHWFELHGHEQPPKMCYLSQPK